MTTSTQVEPEVHAGRRAFATAQALLAGGPIGGRGAQALSVGWYGSTVNPEDGSFALVQQNAGLDDLVGEIISVSFAGRSVFAYVLGVADLPTQVAVTRRLFCALNRLTVAALAASVQPVQVSQTASTQAASTTQPVTSGNIDGGSPSDTPSGYIDDGTSNDTPSATNDGGTP